MNTVIARRLKADAAIQLVQLPALDCFASLAMTFRTAWKSKTKYQLLAVSCTPSTNYSTTNSPVRLLPNCSGLYISSILAAGTSNEPFVEAFAKYSNV